MEESIGVVKWSMETSAVAEEKRVPVVFAVEGSTDDLSMKLLQVF